MTACVPAPLTWSPLSEPHPHTSCHPETVFDEATDTTVHFTSVAPDGSSAGREWYKGWTLFYYAWWVAWSPFVGMFIAKISRGRTVRQVILGSLLGPGAYTFFWFAVFGAAGLRMERQAANFGLDCSMDDPMVELAGRQWWRLSCRASTDMWFDLFSNFPMSKCARLRCAPSALAIPHVAVHHVSAIVDSHMSTSLVWRAANADCAHCRHTPAAAPPQCIAAMSSLNPQRLAHVRPLQRAVGSGMPGL